MAENPAVESATIDLGTLARPEHEQGRQKDNRGLDRKDDDEVTPETWYDHGSFIRLTQRRYDSSQGCSQRIDAKDESTLTRSLEFPHRPRLDQAQD